LANAKSFASKSPTAAVAAHSSRATTLREVGNQRSLLVPLKIAADRGLAHLLRAAYTAAAHRWYDSSYEQALNLRRASRYRNPNSNGSGNAFIT
jgi:hypothetical protein